MARTLEKMSRAELCEFLEFECTKEEVVAVCRTIAEEHEEIYRSGSKDELIAQFADSPPAKSELLDAICDAVGLEPDDEIDEDDDDEDIDDVEWGGPTVSSRSRRAAVVEKPLSPNSERQNQPLWPYQAEALANLVRRARSEASGYQNMLLLQLPTGAGKTRVINTFIRDHVLKGNKRVLWVAPSHELLYQAAKELIEIAPDGTADRLARAGDRGVLDRHLKRSADLPNASVTYLTLQKAARGIELRTIFDIVVVDEVHLGIGGDGHQELIKHCRNAMFIGLSATPKAENKGEFVAQYLYCDLVSHRPRVLASCDLQPEQKTGFRFDGRWSDKNALAVMDELRRSAASDSARNEKIVKSWKPEFGKTLVFATNIEHAKALGKLFRKVHRSDAVGVVHSKEKDSQKPIEDFRNGNLDILINVEQMAHGIDIPDINTVMIARPTESDILYTQMVGRGARCARKDGKVTKEFFNLVDFTDNISDPHLMKMFSGHSKVFTGATSARGAEGRDDALIRVTRKDRSSLMHYDAQGEIRKIGVKFPGLSSIQGFPYRNGQTFGVEIELTFDGFDPRHGAAKLRDKAEKVSGAIREALSVSFSPKRVAVGLSTEKDYMKWRTEFDSSCGLEIVSPVLEGEEGFLELALVCKALEKVAPELGLKANYSTGLHVHLGWNLQKREFFEAFGFLRTVVALEPALAEVLSPSRIFDFDGVRYHENRPNGYCVPLSHGLSPALLNPVRGDESAYERLFKRLSEYRNFRRDVESPHYLALNFENLWSSTGTIEVRYHQGSTEFEKIAGWVSLWMLLLWRPTELQDQPIRAGLPVPWVGDGQSLAEILVGKYGEKPDSPLVQHLARRASESRNNWTARVRKAA